MRENRLILLAHILRKEETKAVILVKIMYVDWKRWRGRPKKYWGDLMASNMRNID